MKRASLLRRSLPTLVTTLVSTTVMSLSTVLVGCLNSSTSNPDAAAGADGSAYAFGGGTIMLTSCGYALTTRDGASAPVFGSPMFGSDPTPWGRHLGIAGDPSTSMVVSWRTNDDTTLATTVQYGTNGMTNQSTDGLTFSYQTPNRNPVQIHETHLCGLQPDTVYTYRVGGKDGSGKEVWSDTATFHTAPAKSNTMAQITVGVIGDSRGNYTLWGKMLQELQTMGTPDIILFSGDGVTLGPVQTEWDQWFKQAEPVLKSVPMLLAHGNHEVNAVNYFSQFAMPGDEEYYGVDYGPMHVTVLNDTPPNPNEIAMKGATFLDSDLTAADTANAPWKFVMHHQPMWSACAGHGSNLTLQSTWGPIIDKHKVDVVFNGHDHDYERTKPMRGTAAQATPADGTVFIVAGSAGADLYDNGTGAWTQLSMKTYNLAVIHLRAGMLQYTAYDDSGTTIDSFMITK